LLLVFASLILGGCGRRRDTRFIPTEEVAHRTLEVALSAWQQGKQPPSVVQEKSPLIRLVDTLTLQKSGQKLAAFSVLGPTTGDAPRCFAVRLTLDNPREEVRARYVVVGLDPLWVVRYEDHEMLCHWDRCDPTAPTGSKKPPT
jgi:hypothetical protein